MRTDIDILQTHIKNFKREVSLYKLNCIYTSDYIEIYSWIENKFKNELTLQHRIGNIEYYGYSYYIISYKRNNNNTNSRKYRYDITFSFELLTEFKSNFKILWDFYLLKEYADFLNHCLYIMKLKDILGKADVGYILKDILCKYG